MRTATATTAAMLALALAGCGGSGEEYADARAIVDKLGCAGTYETDPDAIGTTADETGTCDFEGESVTILWDKDPEPVTKSIAFARTMGGGFGTKMSVVSGGTWAVMTETKRAAEAVQKKLGGDVESQ
jgi:hypothetical protein